MAATQLVSPWLLRRLLILLIHKAAVSIRFSGCLRKEHTLLRLIDVDVGIPLSEGLSLSL